MKFKIILILVFTAFNSFNRGSTFINKTGIPLKAIASIKEFGSGKTSCILKAFDMAVGQTDLSFDLFCKDISSTGAPKISFSGFLNGKEISSRDEQYVDKTYNVYIANDKNSLQVCSGPSNGCDNLMKGSYNITPK